jgi:hypothetical protein
MLKRIGSDKIPSTGAITCAASGQNVPLHLHYLEKSLGGWPLVLLGLLITASFSVTTAKGKAKLTALDYPEVIESITWRPEIAGRSPLWDTVRGVDFHHFWSLLKNGLRGGNIRLADADTSDAAAADVTDTRVQQYYLPIAEGRYGAERELRSGIPTFLLGATDAMQIRVAPTSVFDADHTLNTVTVTAQPVLAMCPKNQLQAPDLYRLGALTTAENAFTIGPFRDPNGDVEDAFIVSSSSALGGGNTLDNLLTVRVGLEWPTSTPVALYQDQLRALPAHLAPAQSLLPFYTAANATWDLAHLNATTNMLGLPVRLIGPIPGAHQADSPGYGNGLLVTLTKTAAATERVIYSARDRRTKAYEDLFNARLAVAQFNG